MRERNPEPSVAKVGRYMTPKILSLSLSLSLSLILHIKQGEGGQSEHSFIWFQFFNSFIHDD